MLGPDEPDEPPPVSAGGSALVAIAIAGILVGGMLATAVLTVADGEATPVAITPETFPREVLGLERDDLQFRDRGARPVVDRLDEHFATQVANHRFAYGGDGATLSYSQGRGELELTIVNGILPRELPRDGYGLFGLGGPVVRPTLVTEDVTCTADITASIEFDSDSHRPAPDWDVPPLLGWTTCVLVDAPRNLSLRLVGEGLLPTNVDAAAEKFSKELRRLHQQLLS